MKQTILVTGGAGYIGSHTCVELLNVGYEVVIVDNLSNSKLEVIDRIEKITEQSLRFYRIDVTDCSALQRVFCENQIDAVIHFAGLKAVGESCEQPLSYYRNNLYGSLVLAKVMAQHEVKRLVFSSSATVYGDPATVPIDEDFPLQATNPYGRSKLFAEEMLRDLTTADQINQAERPWQTAILRYFNPIGAHSSGLIGEDPHGIPNNLMPYILQVAIGKLETLSIFGNDYPTPDGTGVRDYIHVVDLAHGHVQALDYLLAQPASASLCEAFNLGTGTGYSVLDLVNAFRRVTGVDLRYQFAPRRSGDIAECYANPVYAKQKLNWQAEKTLSDMIADAWRWQTQNPQGYQ